MRPNFLVIGAQKAGTTWLYRNLQAHPGIWVPKEKELHYFDEKVQVPAPLQSRLWGDREMDLRWRRQAERQLKGYKSKVRLQDLRWDVRYFFGKYDDRWYASLFEQGVSKVTGEITPNYGILDKSAVAHVSELLPKAKIVLLMRNPIERVWSAADMVFRLGGVPLEQAAEKTPFRKLNNKKAQLHSNYWRTLENWEAFYPPERIFVGFLEDFHFRPEDLLRSLYEFLDVDSSVGYRVVRRKVHSGSTDRINTKVATQLARSYKEKIERLETRFGGYVTFWAYCAAKLSDYPVEGGSIGYPLYESHLWRDWMAEVGEAHDQPTARLRSGPLSTIQAGP